MTPTLPRFITVAAATSDAALKRPQNWAQFKCVPSSDSRYDYEIQMRTNNRVTAGGQEYRLVGIVANGIISVANGATDWRAKTLATLMAREFGLRITHASRYPCPMARIWHGNAPQGAADTLMGRGRDKDRDADDAQAARKAIDFAGLMAARLAARA